MRLARILICAVFAVVVGQAQAPLAPPMPKGTHVLIGRVVEAGSDAPVGGALVTLAGHFDASGKPAPPDPTARTSPPVLSVMATGAGYFVFRDLPAGRFTALVRAPGYMNSDFPPTLIEIEDGRKPAEIRLHVWKFAALGGRVIDEHGDPMAGIVVSALRAPSRAGTASLTRLGTAITDDRGIYRLALLSPGDYIVGVLSTPTTLPASIAAALDPAPGNRETYTDMMGMLIQGSFARAWGCPTCVSSSHEGQHLGGYVLQQPGAFLPPAPDGRPLGFASTYFPGTTTAADATVIALSSGEARSDVDFRVQLVPTTAVSGVVVGPDGPVPHLVVSLSPPGMSLNALEAAGVATAITDGQGRFALLGLTPGQFELSSLVARGNEITGQGRPLWARVPLTVTERGISDYTLTLQPGVPISGRQEFRDASGLATAPEARRSLSLQPVRATSWRTVQPVVQPDGSFRSAGDPPGRYILNASSPPGWFWQTTTLGGQPLPEEMIDLQNSEVTGLVLTFGRATNRISGTVTSPNGAPEPGAVVMVFPANSTAWREGIVTSRRTRTVYATSAGRFEISTLSPDDYFIVAIERRHAFAWTLANMPDHVFKAATRVVLGPEDTKTVTLRTVAEVRR
jgi:hypothetical protein